MDFAKLFKNLEDAKQILRDEYHIEEVDDLWFDSHAEMQHTLHLANTIRTKHKHYRPKSKSKSSSLHDALILGWVRERSHKDSSKVWLVTLDTSLPDEAVQDKKGNAGSCVITLDALLQWISPIAISDVSSDYASSVFAEAIRNQLLPQDKLFTINDFLVFAGMEWDVREMPTQDVEDCITYFRASVPDLNPNDPIDREKIAHELSRFFVDPGRKSKEEVSNLQKTLVDQELASNETIAEIKRETETKDKRIIELEKAIEAKDSAADKMSARRKVGRRMAISAIPCAVIEIASGVLSSSYGQGENIFQKMLSFWPFFTLGMALFPLFCWFIVGKKGLAALGWPFEKLT